MAERATIVGAPAPPIVASRWINAPPGTDSLALADGKVTLIEFTGMGCTYCKATYAPLQQLYSTLGARGFRVVFATGFSSEAQGNPAATSAEAAAIRKFYTEQYGITFPIAIADPLNTPRGQEQDNLGLVSGVNSRYYRFWMEPSYVLIDRHGIVRKIWVGTQAGEWDTSPTNPLRTIIERLLQES